VKVAGSRWMRAAQDRSSWRTLGEAYVQQWTSLAWDDDDDEINIEIYRYIYFSLKENLREATALIFVFFI
jgi:hypothetical protein